MKDALFYIIVACFVAQFCLSFMERIGRSNQRRIYWGCAGTAAACGFGAFYPDVGPSLEMCVGILAVTIIVAYAYTPYIKIGGRIYSITVQNSRPDSENTNVAAMDNPDHDPAPDSYSGIISAKKFWWICVFVVALTSGNIYMFFANGIRDWGTDSAIVALPVFAVMVGYGDASWNYPIARGQRLQFALTAFVTAGAFPLLYLLAYYAGKQWPLRNKRSMEYRSHPRHQRLDGT